MDEFFEPLDGWMFCPEHQEMWGEGDSVRIVDDNEMCRGWEPGQPPCAWVVVFVKGAPA